MTTQPTLFDVCERKHGGNHNSQIANERIAPHKATDRERVRVFVAANGFHGATLKEVAQAFGVGLNQISGRFSELRKAGKIHDSKRSRGNCTVYVSEARWIGGEQ